MTSVIASLQESTRPASKQKATPRTTLPIPSFHISRDIAGSSTDLLIQEYDDRVMVLITQVGKIGCLTQATLPPSIPITPPSRSTSASSTDPSLKILSLLPPPSPSITLLPILGSPQDQALNDIYVSQVAALVWWVMESDGGGGGGMEMGRKAVVVGLTLALEKKLERNTGGEEEEEEEEEEVEEEEQESGIMDGSERMRFAEIMGMVGEWDGFVGSGEKGRGDD